MDTDPPAAPRLDPAAFERIQTAYSSSGPLSAVDRLASELQEIGDYHGLFYARLMRKRVELGVAPFPTGPASEVPPAFHDAYEETIRQAAREVGGIFLSRGDIPRAWGFFRLIGEPEPVKQALAQYSPSPDDDTYPVVDIAWHQQVNPEKGFDIILDRHGVCSAITLVSGADLTNHPDLRTYCIRRLVRALHDQLSERIRADLASRGDTLSRESSLTDLIVNRKELFAEDGYHIDVSHLSSVAQMSLQLPPGSERQLARELCEYGMRLAPQYRGEAEPPFERTFADYLVYLQVLDGVKLDDGLAHFQNKIQAEKDAGNLFPAEVYVNLLVKLDRLPAALAVARQHMDVIADENLTCPGVTELARRVGEFPILAETAKARGDAVTYLAGLIASEQPAPASESMNKSPIT